MELEGSLSHNLEPLRQTCSHPFLVAGGHSRASAIAAVSNGHAGKSRQLWLLHACVLSQGSCCSELWATVVVSMLSMPCTHTVAWRLHPYIPPKSEAF